MFSISFINWILKTDFIFCQFWLPNKFFSFKNKKLFLKTENKEKNSYQTYYKSFLSSNFFIILQFFILPNFYIPDQIVPKTHTFEKRSDVCSD